MRTALDGPDEAGDGLGPESGPYVPPGAAERFLGLLDRAQKAGMI